MGHSKGSLRGKFTVMSTYAENTERSQINDLMLWFKLLEKKEHAKPKKCKRREKIKIRSKIMEPRTK
jgi:hypothetical protein